MALSFYDPTSELDRFLNDAFTGRLHPLSVLRERRGDNIRPRMDLKENQEQNTMTATFELPGMRREDVAIELDNNRLSISGQANVCDTREEGNFVVRERASGSFTRVLTLPAGTKPEDLKATMENGVLGITFPKAVPEQQPKRITIG